MRKTLTILAYVLVAGAVFAGTWTLAGRGDKGVEDLVEQETQDTVKEPVPGQETIPNKDGQPVKPEPDKNLPSGNDAPVIGSLITELKEPPHNPELVRRVSSYLAAEGVNPLAASRVIAYMLITYGDVKRPANKAGFISQASSGTDSKEAVHAAAWVAGELAGIPQMKADIAKWVDKPSGKTETVVNAVLDYAEKDGYKEAEKAATPRFSGELAWKPTSSLFPSGIEPGWGNLKPFLGKSSCTIGDPDLAAIEDELESRKTAAEKADAGNAVKTVESLSGNRWFWLNSSALNPMLMVVGGYVTLAGEAADSVSEEEELRALYATLGAYDALIATWSYKWEHGIAGPIDLYPVKSEGEEVDFRTASPSYPSWSGTYAGFLETYAGTLQQRDIDVTTVKDDMGFITNVVRAIDDPLLHWSIDVEAGRDLGSCYARHAAEAYANNG